MDYRETWNLSSIPDDVFRSEYARRNSNKRKNFGGGRAVTCTCGECLKCRKRASLRVWRNSLKNKEIEAGAK